MTKEFQIPETTESFEALFNEQFGEKGIVGSVVKGSVVKISPDFITVDVGLKSEGRIPLREFGLKNELNIGDKIEVYVDRYEDRDGNIVLSREKARREEAWFDLEKSMEANERVNGVIFGKVKGGFTVDLNGAIAFLPGSQIDIRPIRDISPLMGISQPFQILKMDKIRGNIVVSRRVVLEESRAEARADLIGDIKEGSILDGVIKNITDYGAFVDLGGIDGLLHVTDISWKRINHPSEALSVGQTVKVQVIKFNEDTQRISLGMKQLEEDPWTKVEGKYNVGDVLKGIVTNLTDYGAFIDLDGGVEGLVHVSEMSWTKKNVHPGKIISTSQEVEVKVLEVDIEKRRISLGIKQCVENPWQSFVDSNPAGSIIKGKIKNITEFGLFVGLNDEIDGMIHLSDISWDVAGEEAVKDYTKGQEVEAKIIEVDVEKERISLSIKALTENVNGTILDTLKKGQSVKVTVTSNDENGVNVEYQGLDSYIKKIDLSKDKTQCNPENYNEGDVLEAKVTSIDKKNNKLNLSVKALEVEEEKKVMDSFKATGTGGSSLGDALGEALNKKK